MTLEPDATLETMPSCLFDAVVVPDGEASAEALCSLGHAVEFVKDQYRHCKAILARRRGQGAPREGGPVPLDADDAALIVVPAGRVESGREGLPGPRSRSIATGIAPWILHPCSRPASTAGGPVGR